MSAALSDSLTNIPYRSLATAMTQDPVERSRLGIWRSVGPILGILVLVVVIAPQITRYKTQPEQLQTFLTTVTIVFAVIGYALYLFCFASCKEQVFHEAKPALIFLAYPLTDTRFREIVRELHARHGIRDDRGEAAVESVDATAKLPES